MNRTDRFIPNGVIQLTVDGFVVGFERVLGHPVGEVWQALTEPRQLQRWLGRLDRPYAVGRSYRLTGRGRLLASGSVRRLDAPDGAESAEPSEGVVHSGAGVLEASWIDELGAASIVRWRLAPVDEGTTILSFTTTSPSAEFITEGGAGWQGLLDALDDVLDDREPSGDPEQWLALRDAYAREFGYSKSLGVQLELDGRPAVRFERLLPHRPDEVWSALTDSRSLRRWLTDGVVEPREGGRVELDFNGHPVRGEVLAAEPNRRLDYTWHSEGVPNSIVRWRIAEPVAPGTTLELTHLLDPQASEEAAHEVLAAWHLQLDALSQAIDGAQFAFPVDRWDALFRLYTGADS
ncbi:SRPBCC domain-containing protein [Compostimonas suwonensis]|uniref:Uncharacterized protein YndB with AHSA1/START domain n=1 Tax=Compostimonas suwonensis TaxID=1048394 RepID=A0A2M9BBU8_9MICO|nr:SRPBCC domain-containing protein [Compostimonas suwonensis]PJJ55416.1 uncharacterized protein YndB with AHSA1/START domain [Compostimonas suwonensis]